jgi:hypothetical protein
MPTPARKNRACRTAVRTQPPRTCVPSLDVIENRLRDWLGEVTLPPSARSAPGRPPVLPAMLLWVGLLVGILRGFASQRAVWQLLTQWGLWHFPRVNVTDMAVYKRLERTPPFAMQRFFLQISAAIRQHLPEHSVVPYAAFATSIVAIDQTVLDPVLRKLKILRNVPVGHHALLPGVLTCRFDLRRQQFERVTFSPEAMQNEKPGAPAILKGVLRGSLVLFDLGYFSFPWFDWLAHHGYYYVSRLRHKVS